MVRYILSTELKKLCKEPNLSDNGWYIKRWNARGPGRGAPGEVVFVNILEIRDIDDEKKQCCKTVKLKCFYPCGHIEEGWTFLEAMRPMEIHNFDELFDGRFNQ